MSNDESINPYESPRIAADAPLVPPTPDTGTRIDAICGIAGAFLGIMLSPRAMGAPELTWRITILGTIAAAALAAFGSYLLRATIRAARGWM